MRISFGGPAISRTRDPALWASEVGRIEDTERHALGVGGH